MPKCDFNKVEITTQLRYFCYKPSDFQLNTGLRTHITDNFYKISKLAMSK